LTSIRIAAWSGPRNISTALMRSWESRADTAVIDEPFYAYWLHRTGAPHPGRDDVVDTYPTRWQDVVDLITGPVPGGHPIWFQKHMTKHVLDEVPLDWLGSVRHLFLIRDPAEVLRSFAKVQPQVDLHESGLPDQVRLFERVTEVTGRPPLVVDSRDILTAPRAALEAVCAALDVPFDPAMLSWQPGRRPTDGIWAPYWYGAVERSTGFEPYRPSSEQLPGHLRPLLARCQPLYDQLARHRIAVDRPGGDG
jgi:hypothetical protein